MTDAAVASLLIDALQDGADREAGRKTALVSVAIDMLARAEGGEVSCAVTRRTRTLVFMSAEYRSGGALAASATSVHKIPD
jgi:hypothetical protein